MALKLSQLQITGYGQSNEIPSKNHSINHRIKSRTANHIKRINLLHSLISPDKVSGGLIGAVPIRMVFTVLVFGAFLLASGRTKVSHCAGLALTVKSQGAGMQLHEAVELKEANSAVQEGWKLLAITPGANGVTYVQGKAKPAGSVRSEPLRL